MKKKILPTEVLGRCGQSIHYDIKRHSYSILKWKEHSISSFHLKLYACRYKKCTNQYSYIRVMGLWVLLFSVYFLKRWEFHNSNFLRSEFIFVSRPGKVLCRMLLQRYNPDTFPTNFKDRKRHADHWEFGDYQLTSLVPVTLLSITCRRGKGRGTTSLARISKQTCQPADNPSEQPCTRVGQRPLDHDSTSRQLPGGWITLEWQT